MRIEKGNALAVLDVLPDEIEQKRALARAGCADDVHVPDTLLRGKAHLGGNPGMQILTQDQRTGLASGSGRGLGPCRVAAQTAGCGGCWQNDEAGKLVKIEEYAASAAETRKDVVLMIGRCIGIIRERDQIIAPRPRERGKSGSHVGDDLPCTLRICCARSKPDDHAKKRRCGFLGR